MMKNELWTCCNKLRPVSFSSISGIMISEFCVDKIVIQSDVEKLLHTVSENECRTPSK